VISVYLACASILATFHWNLLTKVKKIRVPNPVYKEPILQVYKFWIPKNCSSRTCY